MAEHFPDSTMELADGDEPTASKGARRVFGDESGRDVSKNACDAVGVNGPGRHTDLAAMIPALHWPAEATHQEWQHEHEQQVCACRA